MDWHPFAERFPILEGAEMAALRESVKATGGIEEQPISFRVSEGKRQGLDGRNRFLACTAEGIEPTFKEVAVTDDEVRAFIIRRNVTRRHLPKELRAQIALELHANGEPIRDIAATLNVSVGTVHHDLNPSCSELNTPEPTTETPQKGGETNGEEEESARSEDNGALPSDEYKRALDYLKAHPEASNKEVHRELGISEHVAAKARKELTPPILCDRCIRVGRAVHGCDMCRAAREAAGKKPATRKATEKPELKDAFGNVVPNRCRDLWADPWIQHTYDFLCVMQEKFLAERVADGMAKRKKRLTMFNVKDFIDGVGFVSNYLDDLIQHMKTKRPAGVCPTCEGNGCATCNMVGMVSREVYLTLKGDAK